MTAARAGTGLLLALLAGAAMAPAPALAFDLPWRKPPARTAAPPRPVVTEILTETAPHDRSVPGVIAARTQVVLGFQTLGRLVMREVDLGDSVAEGQVLARLDPEDLAGNVRAAEAGAEAAQVQLATAETSARRTRELARRKVASQAQLEQAEQALTAAQAAADQAQSELIRARDAAGFAEIRAPFGGVVSAVFENAGAVVAAGAPVLQLSQGESREAVIDLPDPVVATLPADAAFTVWQEGGPEAGVEARVARIEPMADSATRMRRVHLSLEPGAPFRLGALIRARLAARPGQQIMTLPRDAVFDIEGAPHVWRIDRPAPDAREGTAHLAPVRTGALMNGRLTVEDGLAAGAEVVIRGVHSLADGQPVGPQVAP